MIDVIGDMKRWAVRRAWRFVREHTFIGLVLALSGALASTDSSAREGMPASAEAAAPTAQLATFDAVWRHVRDDYYDYERIEADWIEARDTLRPQAAEASRTGLRALLNDMLDRIGESHFLVLPPTGLPPSGYEDDLEPATPRPITSRSTGLGVRLIDGELIIDRVGASNAGLIQPGWQLVAINDESMADRLEALAGAESPIVRERAALMLEATANGRIAYPAIDEGLVLTLRDADGITREVQPKSEADAVETIRIGNLPGLPFSFRSSIDWEAEDCVGTLAFTTWVPQLMAHFDESRDALFACRGLIIDLRGNLGGVLTTMVPLTAHLVDEPVLLGQLMREDGRIDFRAFPRRVANDGRRLTPYDGPVAILIDSMSASTSEMFASGLQALGRARVFGTPSPGMALPAQMRPLPNGDRLMYAFADYIDGQGRRIEGVGVTPDVVVNIRRSDLASGNDPVMEAASAWLRSHPDAD